MEKQAWKSTDLRPSDFDRTEPTPKRVDNRKSNRNFSRKR